MENRSFLIELLRFVALTAPALAIFMQVINDRDGSRNASFRILEAGLTIMVIGGLIIGSQLLLTLEEPTIITGSVFIFGSLPFVAMAIMWRYIPISLDIDLSNIQDYGFLLKQIISLLTLLAVPVVLISFFWYVGSESIVQILSIGPIQDLPNSTVTDLVAVIFGLLVIRCYIYLINGREFPLEEGGQVGRYIGTCLAIILGLGLIAGPVYGLSYLLVYSLDDFMTIDTSGLIFLTPHAWMVLVLSVIYSTDINDEKEK